jgi:transposase
MKKFAGRAQKVKSDVVGLDVHKNVVAFSHLDVEGNEVHAGELASEKEAVLETIRRVTELRPVHVTLEASGGMLWLYDVLVAEFGPSFVHVVHPRFIRMIANSTEKNDANDAYWLAHYTHEGRLRESWMPTGVIRELRIAVRARHEAVRQRSRASVRLKSHLRQGGVKLPGTRMDGEDVQAKVRELASTTSGMLGRALQAELERYDLATRQVDTWDEAIARLCEDMPEVRTVQKSIPGVGSTLAAVIVAESGPMSRFPTPKAYAKYTGLTPSDRSSGGRTIHGGITRQGSRLLRWALTQAVIGCLRGSREIGAGPRSAVARWVDSKQRRTASRGKPRVAAARKLATSIWWLFHRPEQFNAFKAFGAVAPVARP